MDCSLLCMAKMTHTLNVVVSPLPQDIHRCRAICGYQNKGKTFDSTFTETGGFRIQSMPWKDWKKTSFRLMKKGLKASLSPQGYLGESPNPNMNFQFMPTSVGSELCSKVTCSNLMKHIVSCDVSRSGLLSSHRCWYNTTFAAPWPSEVTAQVGLINNWI